MVAAETIVDAPAHPVGAELIPGAIFFCHPQVASVGSTGQAAKHAGEDVKTARMKLGGVGASAVQDDRDAHHPSRA